MSLKLTIGMAVYDDHDGVFFTVMSLRKYQDLTDTEIIVVDNNPESVQGREVRNFIETCKGGMGDRIRYIPFVGRIGTTAPRQHIFDQARGDAVWCMDSHILPEMGSAKIIKDFYEKNPNSKDMLTGPIEFYALGNSFATHFNDQWRGEMWGTWGSAWMCPCGRGYPSDHLVHTQSDTSCSDQPFIFSLIDYADGLATPSTMEIPAEKISGCPRCGKAIPCDIPWGGHEKHYKREGFIRLFEPRPTGRIIGHPKVLDVYGLIERPTICPPGEPEMIEIPGMGLGMFAMRKDAWPGFSPLFSHFGGEEMYIHEKVRAAGGKVYCHRDLRWPHRFGRPLGQHYPLTRFNKMRNFWLGKLELEAIGLNHDVTVVHDHFVKTGLMSQEAWDWMSLNPKEVNLPSDLDVKFTTPHGLPMPGATTTKSVEHLYEWGLQNPRDLNEHFGIMRQYAEKCKHITEFSKRRESPIPFLVTEPDRFVSYNTERDLILDGIKVNRWKIKTDVTVKHLTSSQVDTIEETDLLFIDSTHTAAVMYEELTKYASRVRKYLVFHDTTAYGEQGEDNGPGILAGIRRFLKEHHEWTLVYQTRAQHGLMIFSRLPEDKPKLPSSWEMTKNLAKATAAYVASGAKSVTPEEYERRMKICDLCPQIIRDENPRCGVCGCFLKKKAEWQVSECPVGKWDPAYIEPVAEQS